MRLWACARCPSEASCPQPPRSVGGAPFLEILFAEARRRGFDEFLLLAGHLSERFAAFVRTREIESRFACSVCSRSNPSRSARAARSFMRCRGFPSASCPQWRHLVRLQLARPHHARRPRRSRRGARSQARRRAGPIRKRSRRRGASSAPFCRAATPADPHGSTAASTPSRAGRSKASRAHARSSATSCRR